MTALATPPSIGHQQIHLASVEAGLGPNARDHLNGDVIMEYTEALRAGARFPAVEVYEHGGDYILTDGHHRFRAYMNLGRQTIPAIVLQGDLSDARWAAAAANREQTSLRRSNADKRKAVQLALEAFPDRSDRAIADHVGVDGKTVASVRQELTAELPQSGKRTGRDGRTIDISRIGKSNPTGMESMLPDLLPPTGCGAVGTGVSPDGLHHLVYILPYGLEADQAPPTYYHIAYIWAEDGTNGPATMLFSRKALHKSFVVYFLEQACQAPLSLLDWEYLEEAPSNYNTIAFESHEDYVREVLGIGAA